MSGENVDVRYVPWVTIPWDSIASKRPLDQARDTLVSSDANFALLMSWFRDLLFGFFHAA